MDIKSIIVNYVKNHPGTSFVELENLLVENDFDFEGDRSITDGEHKNLLIWNNWNDRAIQVISELIANNELTVKAADPLVYIIDGEQINLPIAKNVRHYKKPRWMPVVFNVPM